MDSLLSSWCLIYYAGNCTWRNLSPGKIPSTERRGSWMSPEAVWTLLKEVSWQESISHSSLLRLVASSLCLLSCYHCFIILRQTVVYLVYLALCIDPGKLRHDAAHKERDRANCQNSICSCSVCRTQWAVSSIVVLWLGHICKPSDCFYEHSGYSMPGEANVKPRQGHIIRSWLVWALRVCVYIYRKGGGGCMHYNTVI